MSSRDSDGPSYSDAFHVGSSPAQLATAVREMARALDRFKTIDKTHWQEIKRISDGLTKVASDVEKLTLAQSKIDTKLAIYVGVGGVLIGIAIQLVVKFLFK